MLNVYELERHWLKYKIRRYIPVVAAVLATAVLGITALIFWPKEMSDTAAVEQSSAPVETTTAAANTPDPAPAEPVAVAEAKLPANAPAEKSTTPTAAPEEVVNQKLTPSMSFMQSLEEEAMPYYGTETVPQNVATIAATTPKPVTPAPEKTPAHIARAPQPVAQTQAPTVSITPKDANDLQDVIKRFKTNKNPALSLFLARRYYDLGEYQSAYDYALQTNELDSNIEESWLIFAKSLVKKGEEEQAKKVLRSYIQHSNSIRAKSLLDSIQKGTFQ